MVVNNQAGTLSSAVTDSIFKIQYYNATLQPDDDEGQETQEWHGNGMLRFTSKAGTKLLAFTHRGLGEAVILKDPYAYPKSEGGGSIVQVGRSIRDTGCGRKLAGFYIPHGVCGLLLVLVRTAAMLLLLLLYASTSALLAQHRTV